MHCERKSRWTRFALSEINFVASVAGARAASGSSSVSRGIRNMTGTLRNRHDGATQVQRHETDPGEPPTQALTRPGRACIAFRVATSSRTRLRISAAAARCAVDVSCRNNAAPASRRAREYRAKAGDCFSRQLLAPRSGLYQLLHLRQSWNCVSVPPL